MSGFEDFPGQRPEEDMNRFDRHTWFTRSLDVWIYRGSLRCSARHCTDTIQIRRPPGCRVLPRRIARYAGWPEHWKLMGNGRGPAELKPARAL